MQSISSQHSSMYTLVACEKIQRLTGLLCLVMVAKLGLEKVAVFWVGGLINLKFLLKVSLRLKEHNRNHMANDLILLVFQHIFE